MKTMWKTSVLLFVALPFVHFSNAVLAAENNEQESTEKAQAYAVGFNMGKVVAQSANDLDHAKISDGFVAGLTGAKPSFTEKELEIALEGYRAKRALEHDQLIAEQVKKNSAAAEAFLRKLEGNKKVKALASGVPYEMLSTVKDGKEVKSTDTVKLGFIAKKLNGEVFDSSEKNGKPIIAEVNSLLPAWRDAVLAMKAGERALVYVTAENAFGKKGIPGKLEAGEMHMVELHLMELMDLEHDGHNH